MSWKLVDVDASKAAGKARPDEWAEWSKLISAYDVRKISPKDSPPEMLEFVPLDKQPVDNEEEDIPEEELEVKQDESDDVVVEEKIKTEPSKPGKSPLSTLKCPDYFCKPEKIKRQSNKPTKFTDEFGAPAVKKQKKVLFSFYLSDILVCDRILRPA